MSHHKAPNQHQPHILGKTPQMPEPAAAASPGVPAAKPQACGADRSGSLPTADHIRARAYEISQLRHGGPGDANSDWSQAETELLAAAAVKG